MKINEKLEPSSCIVDDEEEVALPGFRFHPTDEELVGFYLRRKVDKKALSIELIKQVDIYKFDPWDLPKASGGVDIEGYFFCKRGRKYRNSVRPNRVTGSGFWKATGIDKPVYSSSSKNVGDNCIGLKKTLVYYRGSAGKGTKTDWMMHEFRLPINDSTPKSTNSIPEAEVWTLCRIFKRNVSHRKYTPDWRELSNKRQQTTTTTTTVNMDTSSNICSVDSNITRENYLNFSAPTMIQYSENKPLLNQMVIMNNERKMQLQFQQQQQQELHATMAASSSNISSPYGNEFFGYSGDWDELRSVVEFALDPSHL